uniref:Uncharacterized protein n=1 Tax=Trichuris muris TaxID=70415 RepID=A0A5S6Q9F6_TRIMR
MGACTGWHAIAYPAIQTLTSVRTQKKECNGVVMSSEEAVSEIGFLDSHGKVISNFGSSRTYRPMQKRP